MGDIKHQQNDKPKRAHSSISRSERYNFQPQQMNDQNDMKSSCDVGDAQKFDTNLKYFKFGSDGDFRDGLTGKISKLVRSMEEECLTNDNGAWREHYEYVVKHPACEAMTDPNAPHRIRDKGHEGLRLEDFVKHKMAVDAKLTSAEVAAIRMYTGPLYAPWNKALRLSEENPSLLESWGTCISVLYNSILKLSYSAGTSTVYRGVSEVDINLPTSFVQAEEGKFAGGVEMAFMSTSTDLSVAIEYATRGFTSLACSIFEIEFDAASRGASVQWASQYPYEEELLYPPCTYLTCKGPKLLAPSAIPKAVLTHVGEMGDGLRCLRIVASVSTARPDIKGIVNVDDHHADVGVVWHGR